MLPIGAELFVLFFQDHPHDVGVPPVPLPALLRVLLLQRPDVCAAGSADLLGRAHFANGCQIPARQRMKHHFLNFIDP